MKLWVTEIRAIDPIDGEIKTWAGPNVPGISWSLCVPADPDNDVDLVFAELIDRFKAAKSIERV